MKLLSIWRASQTDQRYLVPNFLAKPDLIIKGCEKRLPHIATLLKMHGEMIVFVSIRRSFPLGILKLPV